VIATGHNIESVGSKTLTDLRIRGVYYAATAMEGLVCGGNEIVVVEGGNSVGRGAVFLSSLAAHVHLLLRTDSLVKHYVSIFDLENRKRFTHDITHRDENGTAGRRVETGFRNVCECEEWARR
jgi:thioredoxin reductase (NADPH)